MDTLHSYWNKEVENIYLPDCSHFKRDCNYKFCISCFHKEYCLNLKLQFQNQSELQTDLLKEQQEQM
jgi:hypothetical protein